MNARTFGTDDKQAEFFARYGTGSYEETGRAITDAQRNRQVGTAAAAPVSPVFVDQATPRAIEWLVTLWMERSNKATEEQVRAWAKSVDRRVVSEKIDWLKTQPKLTISDNLAAHLADDAPAPRPGSLERHNVPAGRYAVTGNEGQTVFVKVDRPTEGQWAGRIFVKVQAGDDMIRTSRPQADALLGKIAADGVQAAMLRYGREIGSCGHCGRTLTNEESREAGIGPVCRGKMGW